MIAQTNISRLHEFPFYDRKASMDDMERLAQARAIALSSGRSQEHLKFALDFLDRREIELVSRAEDAEREVARLRELEEERIRLLAEIEHMRRIYDLAIEWRTAIQNLEASHKKGETNKGGEGVYKSNQALTKAHLALKSELESHITRT